MVEGLNISDEGFNWKDQIILTNAKRQTHNVGLAFVRTSESAKAAEIFETPLRICTLFLTCYQLINQFNPRILFPSVSSSYGFNSDKPDYGLLFSQPLTINIPKSDHYSLKEEDMIKTLNKTAPLFEKVIGAVEKQNAIPMEIAMLMYYRSLHTMESIEDFLVLVTALEALFSDGSAELRYKIALRTAIMVRNYLSNTRHTFEELKDIYNERSKLIHGSTMPKLFPSDLIKYKMKLLPIVRCSLLNYVDAVADGKTKDDIIKELDDRALGVPLK